MSRCFPYPPPGYTLRRGSEEALVESIKLQKERQKAKEQRKEEKKREKKEKRKDKKEKHKEKKDKTGHENKTCQKLGELDEQQSYGGNKSWTGTKGELPHMRSVAEPEQLERSSLTEEHGQPVSLRVPSSSSDSTENSNKRKRQSSPTDAARGPGKIIRIRLSSKGQNQSNEQQHVCSTFGRIHHPSQNGSSKGQNQSNEQQHVCSTFGMIHHPSQNGADVDARCSREGLCSTSGGTSNMVQGFDFGTFGEQICSTSQSNKTVAAAGKTQLLCLTKMQRMELQYTNLTENWAPPQLDGVSCEPEDLDWLFQGKNQSRNAEKRQISANDGVSCSSSSELFPRARPLQEVDLYALPFTVPF